MRIVLIIACAAVFVFSAWSNTPTTADPGHAGTTVDPIGLMAQATGLPVEQYDTH